MKKSFKYTVTTVMSLVLLLGIVQNVRAAATWITFSTELPRLSADQIISGGEKQNNSNARVNTSYVGGDYLANMWIVDFLHYTKLTGTLTGMGDGSDRELTVDQKGVGKTVALMGENATWTTVMVELSGRWQIDTK